MEEPLTYAFGDFIVNGLGADLIRIIELIYYCQKNDFAFHLLGYDDQWLLVPSDTQIGRCWLHYFKSSIPIDWYNAYPRIVESDIALTKEMMIDELHPFNHFSDLLRSIYRPSDHMMKKKEKLLNKFNYLNSENYIAIHIRRGDKTSGPWAEANLIQLDTYLDALNRVLESAPTNIQYVYVATDSDEVIVELQSKTLSNDVKFVYDSDEVRHDGYVYKLYTKDVDFEEKEKEMEIITFMKNIDLLVGADELIGSRMSFFFIVAELLRGKKGINLSENLLYTVNFY